MYPFAKTYVESGLGFGTSGGIAFEQWSDRWIVRSASYANWVRNTSATDWTQSFIVGYAGAVIEERRYDRLATGRDLACGAAARVSASGDRVSRTSLHEASVLMKRPLHGGWLYGYFEPVVRWDRAFGWYPDLGVRIGFDALFGGSRHSRPSLRPTAGSPQVPGFAANCGNQSSQTRPIDKMSA